jgi:hypothetical protein
MHRSFGQVTDLTVETEEGQLKKVSGRLIATLCTATLVWLSSAVLDAQRGPSAASGGSTRPARPSKDRPAPSPRLIVGAAPGAKCDPDTVEDTCPWTYTLIYGFTANAAPRDGGADTAKAGLAFNLYLDHRDFVEVDNDNVLSSHQAPADRVTGFGDTTFYVGRDLVLDKPQHPSITIEYGIKAPTASKDKGLGSGQVDHTYLVAVGKSVDKTSLEFDIGDYLAGNGSGFDHAPFWTAIVKQKVGEAQKFAVHAEVGGDFATSQAKADAYTLDYLETVLNKHVTLRTGGRFGLTSNVARAGVYVGVKVTGLFGD